MLFVGKFIELAFPWLITMYVVEFHKTSIVGVDYRSLVNVVTTLFEESQGKSLFIYILQGKFFNCLLILLVNNNLAKYT